MQQQKKTRNTVLFQMFLEPSLAKRLKQRAREESLPMSGWVRQVITFALDKPSHREQARQEVPTV